MDLHTAWADLPLTLKAETLPRLFPFSGILAAQATGMHPISKGQSQNKASAPVPLFAGLKPGGHSFFAASVGAWA